ncbi:MAG: hypothetical protein F4Y24_03470 [Gemmatimonadetes bacterium]|nr:hypothetical protein [Gemmatimonadota bacterium]MYG22472.1 hypothetical protein [Gemmatimonadota bacterium]MYJ39643.1 hypothetical protein [Gemmatimonadota bacterium]
MQSRNTLSANRTEGRPDAMADVPGICELPLTRGVVQYRDVHELYHPGGRIRDIGLAVILSGRFASSVRAVDLGSADVKYLNLTSELVILDWVYDPTLMHLRRLSDAAERNPSSGDRLRRYCFDLALRVLNRRGFTPLTRPILLRIGFRDVCQDLDLHESTVVRIITGSDRLTRVHLDYEANTLVFRTARRPVDDEFTGALAQAFPGLQPERQNGLDADGCGTCRIRLGIPVTFSELRGCIQVMRRGLGHLVARFEPRRFREVRGLVSTFGARATLDRLSFAEPVGGDTVGTAEGLAMSVH